MKKVIIMLVLATALLLPVMAGGATEDLAAVQERGKLILGTSADYAPYEFHTIIDGKDTIVGFDIEIAKAIAADMGVELEIQDIGFDGLLQALNSGKVDMVIAGMTPTEERKQSVDFSQVYYIARQAVMVRADDAGTYTSIDALAGQPVGAQLSSIQEGLVKDEMPESRLVALGKIPDLVLELKNSKVEALVVELPVANGYVNANDDLAIAPIEIGDVEGGSAVAVRKGSEELLAAIDATLSRLLADGSIDRFVAEANELNVTE
jgi:ABC-type amino acid transport substrate-binding protein